MVAVFFYDAFWIRIPRLLSISRTSYFLPRSGLFPFPERKRRGSRKKKKEKKRKGEKKEKIHLVASRKLDLLELFIGNIIYIEWNVFFAHFFRLLANRIDRISVHNDKILPGNVCSARSYCFRQFFNNNYASKRLNNGTQDFCFFSKHLRSFFFFFALEEIHDVCAARNPWHFCNPPWMLFFTQIIPPVFFIPLRSIRIGIHFPR